MLTFTSIAPNPHMKLFHDEVGRGSWRALCLLILGGDERQWQEHLSSAPLTCLVLPLPSEAHTGPPIWLQY